MRKHWTVQKGEWYSRELDTADSTNRNSRYIGTAVSRVQRTVQKGKRHSREKDTTERVQEYTADSTEVRRVQQGTGYSRHGTCIRKNITAVRRIQRTVQQGKGYSRLENIADRTAQTRTQ